MATKGHSRPKSPRLLQVLPLALCWTLETWCSGATISHISIRTICAILKTILQTVKLRTDVVIELKLNKLPNIPRRRKSVRSALWYGCGWCMECTQRCECIGSSVDRAAFAYFHSTVLVLYCIAESNHAVDIKGSITVNTCQTLLNDNT